MKSGLKEALQVAYAHIYALPNFITIFWFQLFYFISPNLLDRITPYFRKLPFVGIPDLTELGIDVKPSQRMNFFGTTELYYFRVKKKLEDIQKRAVLLQESPNPRLYDLKSQRWLNLLDCESGSRPLAVIFGSCS